MAILMKRDAPKRTNPDEDIMSIHDSSDIEMLSVPKYDRETDDNSPDSDTGGSHLASDGSDRESDRDQGSGHQSDSNSEQGSYPGSIQGSDAGSYESDAGDPEFSDDSGGDFLDLFLVKRGNPDSSKNPQSRQSSNSQSRL